MTLLEWARLFLRTGDGTSIGMTEFLSAMALRSDKQGPSRRRRTPASPLSAALQALRKLYGRPGPEPARGPFELLLYENVAYLANDARRDEAFRLLRERVGLSPEKILAAAPATLREAASRGIVPDQTVEKLRAIAAVALEELGGDLEEVIRRPVPEALKALRKFPSIGEPGAQKVLLFCRREPFLALDSNGLRVLLRLGYGKEDKSYARSYRSAQEAADAELPRDCGVRIEAHLLLRRHGQELCRRSQPRCEICPVRSGCVFAVSREL
jgi:endonuclease-3